MELGVGRIGAILGPFAAGLLQQWSGGPGLMFLAIGAAGLCAAAIITLARAPQVVVAPAFAPGVAD